MLAVDYWHKHEDYLLIVKLKVVCFYSWQINTVFWYNQKLSPNINPKYKVKILYIIIILKKMINLKYLCKFYRWKCFYNIFSNLKL